MVPIDALYGGLIKIIAQKNKSAYISLAKD
jgi:hypothetical protein